MVLYYLVILRMMKMKNKFKIKKNLLCEIEFFNIEQRDFSIIINYDDSNIILAGYTYFGEFDGIMICPIRIIRNIEYNNSYLLFLKNIYEKKDFSYFDLKDNKDFIRHAFNNNKIIGISRHIDSTIKINDIKVLRFDKNYIYYNEFDSYNYSLLKVEKKVKINSLKLIQIESKFQKILEKR